jgi:hypothetical protein
MIRNTLILSVLLWFSAWLTSCNCHVDTDYADNIQNTEHPRIVYWFITPDLLQNDRYLTMIDTIAERSPFDLVFLSAREGCNFFDTTSMKPVFQKLVARAHERGIKVGLQLWNPSIGKDPSISQRTLTEAEIKLDKNGNGHYQAQAQHIRMRNFYRNDDLVAYKTDIFRAFAFQKVADDVYDPLTLKDITEFCDVTATASGDKATIKIRGGKALAGYTVYLMTEHYYNHPELFSAASRLFTETLEAYASVPFDGTALDEFGYMRITPPWEMTDSMEFDTRFYSPAMSKELEEAEHSPAEIALLHMRYYPRDSMQIKARAINRYMSILKTGPLRVENDFYETSKKLFGEACFIGVHNTFHNSLTTDEIWATGINWWTIRRDYGHTDEHSSLPVQLGVLYANPKPVIYNMFYHADPDTICMKALHDLRYGIRTHYHAINDKHWGVGLESETFLRKVRPVEDAAALLNRFNLPRPDSRLLVVFGEEALANWFPVQSSKSPYLINHSLQIEEKALALQQAGYLTTLAPSGLIENGSIRLNENKELVFNDKVFSALVFLYPEYSREKTLLFIEDYLRKGGKLMFEGSGSLDFDGKTTEKRIQAIREKAIVKKFDPDQVDKLGVKKNMLANACLYPDTSVVFTHYESFTSATPAQFDLELGGNRYTGLYTGMLAFKTNGSGIIKLTSTGLVSISINNKVVLAFQTPQALFISRKSEKWFQMTLYDRSKKVKPTVCRL